MSCLHCRAAHQSLRFCTRCGKRMPRTEPSVRASSRVRRAPASRGREPGHREREIARALRGGKRTGPAGETAQQAAPAETVAARRVSVQGMYDRAMARAAVPARAPLQRYLAVLAQG